MIRGHTHAAMTSPLFPGLNFARAVPVMTLTAATDSRLVFLTRYPLRLVLLADIPRSNRRKLEDGTSMGQEEKASKAKLTHQGDRWFVPSQSGRSSESDDKRYVIMLDVSNSRCSCQDHEIRCVKCKHTGAVEFTSLSKYEYTNDGQTVTEPVTVKTTYSQDWPACNAAQTSENDQLQALLHQLCQGIGKSSQKIGRPRLPLEDMVISLYFKVYSPCHARCFMSDLRETQKKDYISTVPHYNSMFNYFESEALTPYLKMLIEESSLPLAAIESDFAVDSSGFSTSRFVQCVNAKYTNRKFLAARGWVKIILMCGGVKRNIVTAVTLTDRFTGDSPHLKPLVEATAKNFVMRESQF